MEFSNKNILLLVGLVFVLLVIFIGMSVAICYQIRKHRKSGYTFKMLFFAGDNKLTLQVGDSTSEEQDTDGNDPPFKNRSSTERVKKADLESYFNRIIHSTEFVKDYTSVVIRKRDSSIGMKPANLKKNQSVNVLPFDATRVTLTLVNGNPDTDYINASNIEGYGSQLHYIAAQGPKGREESTIKDFWRMVVQKGVTAIIMVADFFKDGERVIGQYVSANETLGTESFNVTAIDTEIHHCYSIYKMQVRVHGHPVHHVTHYHYTNWPQHHVPVEPRSVAHMIRHFISHHTQGGVVVHSLLGTGRTGTILLVLLLHDMLSQEGSLNPKEVLTRLRQCRMQTVENVTQYRFALQVIDEVLFGNITALSVSDFQKSLPSLLDQSQLMYEKFISLRYLRSHKRCSNSKLSRQQKIAWQKENAMVGDRYVSTTAIPGLVTKNALLVTEHPITLRVEKFWQVVIAHRCPIVVFINSFSGHSREEYPTLIGEKTDNWSVEGVSIYIHDVKPYKGLFTKYSVYITNTDCGVFRCSVYQVLGWNFSCDVPKSLNMLVTLGDLLLKSPITRDIGPPLLCCGDGLTACGLVAACRLLFEHVKTEQTVDVYRIAVKLRRCNNDFITSEEQFKMLYEVVASYIEESKYNSNCSSDETSSLDIDDF